MNARSTDKGPSEERVDLELVFGGMPAYQARPSIAYRIGLAAVALAMVTLPGVYLALIGVIVGFLYAHAVGAIDIILASPHWFVAFLLYFSPFFLGLVLLLFLVKPFFARPLGGASMFPLDSEREPALFETINRLCRMLHAPAPYRIEVDCQANASAGFDMGLLGLVRKKLVLTIGLPLAAGMNVTQFVGVLAHEFGHFGQRWGMVLVYIVRSVSGWLSQSVYARDHWDDWLLRMSRRSHWPFAVPFLVARGLVWMCRRILWGLMVIGHLISCYMLRQMEYDADKAEARVAGREDFEQACLCLVDLNAATAVAMEGLEIGWRQDRLPDNLPAYIVGQALSESQRAEIRKAALLEKTRIFDTHPALGDRIGAITRAATRVPVSCAQPAGALFTDFDQLCRDVTRFHYRVDLGLEFCACNLVNADRAITQDQTEMRAWSASMSLFRGAMSALRPFPLALEDLRAARPAEELVRWMMSARMRLERSTISVESTYRTFVEADSRLIDVLAARTLHSAGFAIRPEQFGLAALDPDTVAFIEQQAIEQRAKAETELRLFDTDVRTRVAAALQLLQFEEFRARLPEGEKLPDEVRALVRALGVLRHTNDLQVQLRFDSLRLDLLFTNRMTAPDPEDLDRKLADVAYRVRTLLKTIRSLFTETPHPFPGDGPGSITDHVWENLANAGSVEAVHEEAGIVASRLYTLYYRVLGRLAEITEQVERCANRPAPKPY